MTRTILLWALVLALGGFAIEWLQQQYLAHALSRDLYVSLIGVAFAAGGVWSLYYLVRILPALPRPRQQRNQTSNPPGQFG